MKGTYQGMGGLYEAQRQEQAEAAIAQRAAEASRPHVFVLTLELRSGDDYAGWTSVHRSLAGARARIDEKVGGWDMAAAYAAARRSEVADQHCIASGDEGDSVIYGITLLPVED